LFPLWAPELYTEVLDPHCLPVCLPMPSTDSYIY